MKRPVRATLWIAALALAVSAGIAWLARTSDTAREVVHRAAAASSPSPAAVPVDEAPEPSVALPPTGVEAEVSAATGAVEPTPATSQRKALVTAARATVLALRVVSEEEGEPLGGVRVVIRGERRKTKTTDAAGRIEREVEAGVPHTVAVVRGGEERPVEPLASGERREVVLRLPTVELWGRVVARESGLPIAGARLDAESAMTFGPQTTLVSGEDGAFRLHIARPVTAVPSSRAWAPASAETALVTLAIELVVAAPDRATWTGVVHAPRGEGGAELVVSLARAARLVVLAVDEDGEPIERARVHLTRPDGPKLFWRGSCDAAGRFEVDGVSVEQPLELVVAAGERRVKRTIDALQPGERRDVHVALGPEVTVLGRVIDSDGAPVSCQVWMVDAGEPAAERYFRAREEPEHTAGSDGDGRFQIKHVRPGWWWIGPASGQRPLGALAYSGASQGMMAPWARVVAIPPEPQEQDLVLVVRRDLSVSGTVVGRDGRHAPRVVARSLVGAGSLEGTCQDDGTFRLELGPGSHELVAHHPSLGRSELVVVESGERELVLELSGGVAVRGRVLGVVSPPADDPDSDEIGLVAGWPAGGDSGSMPAQEISRSGEFVLEKLAAGRYHLLASTFDGRMGTAVIEVVHGNDEVLVEIPLARTGQLVVRRDAGESTSGVRWRGGSGLSLTCGGVEITQIPIPVWRDLDLPDLDGWTAQRSDPSLEFFPAPIGVPLELSTGSEPPISIVLPDSGRLEIDLTRR